MVILKQMQPSWIERWARDLVVRFLNDFIASGCLILMEEDSETLTFRGGASHKEGSQLKVVQVKVHSPQFYWKVATQADLGFADSYINGDISLADSNEGLLNLFLILITNRDLKDSSPRSATKMGWWTPLILSAGFASANYYFKHVLRQNTLTQARRNISRHYDLSNELFSLFLDETMTYSCAIFESKDEELKDAQLRKTCSLIEKARISKEHHVLEIGFGWGTLAIEAVTRTGCQYTGITLSEKQLIYAEQKVKEAGLQDRIKFILCDYRQLPDANKYDRIISCEMLEHVGHEYQEMFFSCCESILAENGILLLQFTSVPDQKYEGYRRSSNFATEYIFPGGCLPSLNRVLQATTAGSRLCIEQVENIGFHYYPTLRNWRKNMLKNEREILALGFDEKFLRTWEYYFDYFAAGFKSCTLENYQIVLSRPGNVLCFGNLGNSESISPSPR